MLTLPKSLKTKNATVQLMDNGILHISFDANCVISIADVNELLDATFKMGNGKKFKKLITLGKYTLIDLDAMKLAGSPEGAIYQLAEGIVIKSTAQRILANFYTNVIKPINPTKFFTDETEAENWLLNIS